MGNFVYTSQEYLASPEQSYNVREIDLPESILHRAFLPPAQSLQAVSRMRSGFESDYDYVAELVTREARNK